MPITVQLPHHKLHAFGVAKELLVAVRDSAVRDADLRNQAMRAARVRRLDPNPDPDRDRDPDPDPDPTHPFADVAVERASNHRRSRAPLRPRRWRRQATYSSMELHSRTSLVASCP